MFVTLETLGRPIVMKRVWKSFVATNPDALYKVPHILALLHWHIHIHI